MASSRDAPAHLVHGMGAAAVAPTWPAITPDEAAMAVARFAGAGRVTDLLWHSPRPFSAATLIRADRGDYLLKRHHHGLRTVAGLAEEHRFITHLARGGLPVPDVIPAVDGGTAIAIGPWTYELHRAAAGEDLYRDRTSWTPFLSHGHAHAAGAALARLHDAARGFDAPARSPRPLVASFTILPARDPLAAAGAYIAARPALAGFMAGRRWQEMLAPLFDDGLPALLADQPDFWTHNDWHPSNLSWTAQGTMRTIFDFGLADRTCAVHDIAVAIERSAVRWLELDGEQDAAIGDAGAARALLAGYASVLPLRPADVALVARLLPSVHLEFALSEIDYFAGVAGDPAAAMLAWDAYLIGHARWFASAAGRDFLTGIADEGVGG
jgi:Ser/Thr protein kinase RdoA (MazF antagonist)